MAGGGTGTVLAPLTRMAPSDTKDEAGVLAAAYWSRVGAECFARIYDLSVWIDHCYHMYKEINDGSSNYDYYALKRFATMGRDNSLLKLSEGRIRATRSGGASQSWIDWDPRSDWSGGSCGTVEIGVTSPIGGITVPFERCPNEWDMWSPRMVSNRTSMSPGEATRARIESWRSRSPSAWLRAAPRGGACRLTSRQGSSDATA